MASMGTTTALSPKVLKPYGFGMRPLMLARYECLVYVLPPE